MLYVCVTGDLRRRILQHREGSGCGFTARYRCNRLVWCKAHADVLRAIAREKEIKGWIRSGKITLIESENSTWEDLGKEMFDG